MNANERAKQLHDLATRGTTLSPEEQQELLAWYAEQDRAEADMLRVPAQDSPYRRADRSTRDGCEATGNPDAAHSRDFIRK